MTNKDASGYFPVAYRSPQVTKQERYDQIAEWAELIAQKANFSVFAGASTEPNAEDHDCNDDGADHEQ